MKSQLKATQNK